MPEAVADRPRSDEATGVQANCRCPGPNQSSNNPKQERKRENGRLRVSKASGEPEVEADVTEASAVACVGGVMFQSALANAVGHIVKQTSEEPPKFLVKLLFSFRGINEVEVPADRIHGDK